MNKQENPFALTPTIILAPLFFVLLMWLVFWVEIRFRLPLSDFGIFPRTFSGLRGIVCSPFLHGDTSHLLNNTLPILILLMALFYFYKESAVQVVVLGILLSGLGTWLIGRNSYHIGASGLVYVLVSFIFFKGIQTKYYRLIALSLAVVLLYGGTIWYMFPDVQDGISWEGHLAGFVVGFVLHLFTKKKEYPKQYTFEWEQPDFDPSTDSFMKHFDENGNFAPKKEIEEEQSYFSSDVEVNYNFIESKQEF